MPNNNKKKYYHKKNNSPSAKAEIEATIKAHEEQYSAEKLMLSLEQLGLSEPTRAMLDKNRILTAADLIRRTENEMYKVQGLNKKVLWELKDALKAQQMSFREPPPKPKNDGGEILNGDSRTQNVGAANENRRNAAPRERGEKKDRQDAPRTTSKFGLDSRDVKDSNSEQRPPRQRDNRRENVRDGNRDKQDGNRDNKRVNTRDNTRDNNRGDKQRTKTASPQKPTPPKPEKLTQPLEVADWRKVMKGGKWGFSDGFKTVIPPMYDEVFCFKDGLASVEIGEKCGYIDCENNVVIPLDYDTAMSFSEGLASVVKGDKCGYINKNNEVILPFEYDAATQFENGEAKIKKDGKWGTITPDGKITWI